MTSVTADQFSNKWLVHLEGIGCGGVIIGANWVLTSAECCDGATMKDLFTAANDWDYNTYYDSETIHIPDQKIIHPGSVFRSQLELLDTGTRQGGSCKNFRVILNRNFE